LTIQEVRKAAVELLMQRARSVKTLDGRPFKDVNYQCRIFVLESAADRAMHRPELSPILRR
jgi:hypothetical protein